MPSLFQHGKIDNVLTEGDTNSRPAIARFKDTERQILERKLRIGCDVDERFEWHGRDIALRCPDAAARRPYLTGNLKRANLRAARRSCSCQTKSQIFGAL